MIKQLLYSILRLLPIKRNRVLFISYYGAQYGCNPKYISQELINKYSNSIEVVWAFVNPAKHNIRGAKIVKYNSLEYFLMLATSKVICTNYRMTFDFIKRAGQKYIQTWHSSLRLKKIEGDTESTLPAHYVEMAKHDSNQTDFVIAGCRNSHDTFSNSFWYKGTILDYGTPRNDILFKDSPEIKGKIRNQLSISQDKKIVIYAPTFRKDKSTDCYKIDFNSLRDNLSKKFGGEWVVLLRLHPHLIGCEIFKGLDNVIDVTNYDDIQELLLISDVLISDYSSLMFDFAISKKPVFLFATDVEDYCKNDRALYFDINTLPFPLAENNDMLIKHIESFNMNLYIDEVNRFNDMVGSYETGTASAKVSNLIISLLEQ